MSKLRLPDVSLVMVTTVAHELSRLAVEDCLRHVEFGNVFWISDEPPRIRIQDVHWERVNSLTLESACQVYWYTPAWLVKTSHFLICQPDSWIINPEAWDPAFLEYDYIGAPWGWHGDKYEVGNGGFSLRSTALAKRVASDPTEYPFGMPEDDVLCRRHRPALEAEGFRFAPLHLAAAFSYERIPPFATDGLPIKTFGFHGMFNWPAHLTDEQIAARLALAPNDMLNSLHCRQMCAILRTLGRRHDYTKPGSKVYAT